MIYVADANNRTDGVAHRFLSMIETDIPLVLISRMDGFVFNEKLNELKGKKWVLCDFVENGWEWDQKHGNIWNYYANHFDFLRTTEYDKFREFVNKNPPALTFSRELLKKDRGETLLPIEYPNWQEPIPVQSREEFNKRPLSVFNFWGRSHESRVQLHADIWKHSSKKGYSVCDSIYYFNTFMQEENGEKWATFWMPHYGRVDLSMILGINALSKLSISMNGAGVKCFRSTGESPVNSIMVLPEDKLSWSYEWIDKVNCFRIKNNAIETIEEALSHPYIYDIYLYSVETANKYNVHAYIKNYIQPILNNL